MNIEQPVIYILVGPPNSGKTTWIGNNIDKLENVIVSSDDIIDVYAAEHDMNYGSAWQIYNRQADKLCKEQFTNAVGENKNVVVDRTNVSAKSRKYWLQRVSSHYRKVAVNFNISLKDLLFRNRQRQLETGKFIPVEIIKNMCNIYEHPSIDEGFDEIINVSFLEE